MALRLLWQAQKKLAPSLGVRLLQNPTTHFTVPLRFHHTAGSSNGVIPTHACSRPAYLDLGKNSLVDRILRAAATENLHEFKYLCEKELGGCKGLISIKDPEGRGLLHVAAKSGSTNVCKYLIQELGFSMEECDNEDSTPLCHACLKGHLNTAEYLIENGADPHALQRHNTTALHAATLSGSVEIISLLLSKGVDVNAPSQLGTPLHQSQGRLGVVRVLLDHGANPNICVSHQPTPLQSAVVKGTLECVKLLIKAGADPNGSSLGFTPLDRAALLGKIDYVQCLLEAGADPNVPDDTGLKPILKAARCGHEKIVEILFPLTSPISVCSDSSISGIMKYADSKEIEEQIKSRSIKNYWKEISRADDYLKRKEYYLAAIHYSLALCIVPKDHFAFSKRSLCYARSGYYDFALSDAHTCETLTPDWPETYLRGGVALTLLKAFDMAEEAFLHGLALDPENKELQNALLELAEEREKAGPNPAVGYVC